MNDENKKELLLTNIFPTIVSFIMLLFFLKYKIGYLSDILIPCSAFLISLFILNISEFITFFFRINDKTDNKFNYSPYILFILLVLIFFIGLLNVKLISIFFTFLFIISGIISFVFILKNSLYKKKSLLFILLLLLLFSLFITGVIWGSGYHNILYLEKIIMGNFHIDTLYHSSIMSMIKTYGIPSTGLDGVKLINYHTGSHYYFAMFSNLMNCDSMTFYNIVYPIVFIPLLVKTFTLFIMAIFKRFYSKVSINLTVVILLIIVGFCGFLPYSTLYKAAIRWDGIFISESYLFSLIFVFMVLTLSLNYYDYIVNKKKADINYFIFIFLILPFSLFIVGYSKISLIVLFLGLIFWSFIRFKLFKKIYNIAALFFLFFIFYLVYKLTSSNSYNNSLTIELFHFFKNNVSMNFLFYILIYFFWSITYLIFRFYFYFKDSEKTDNNNSFFTSFLSNKFIDCEFVIILCILGVLPGIFLPIGGGSAAYFSDFQNWFSICLLIPLLIAKMNWCSFNIKNNLLTLNIKISRIKVILYFFVILCCIFAFYNIYSSVIKIKQQYIEMKLSINERSNNNSFRSQVREKLKNISMLNAIKVVWDLASVKSEDLKIFKNYSIISKLLDLNNLSKKEKRISVVYIDRKNMYWSILDERKTPFLCPALTGIAMLDGLPTSDIPNLEGYSFSFYNLKSKDQIEKITINDVIIKAKNLGFKKLIYLDGNNNLINYDVN